ncbi:MAG: aldo/keto reductase [Anaerolineae bacterium]|nr:aldo/keto reductase [Anaerolineae bacterium]
MKQYCLTSTDLSVSRIAFGCMRLAGKEQEGLRAVQAAINCGINFFDHADIYGAGRSEEVFSRILIRNPGLRGKIILQSKCGIRFADTPQFGMPPRFDFSYDHILASVDGILKRLGTDYLDILLLHRPDPLVELEEVAAAFLALQKSGKVRHFGVSNHNASQIALLAGSLPMPIVANQLEVSVEHNQLIEEGIIFNQNTPDSPVRGNGTLEYCRLHHIMIQAWSPLAGGRLGRPVETLSPTGYALISVLQDIAHDHQVSVEAIMIAWLLRHPAHMQPIIGTMNPERVIDICAADEVKLSREEWYRIYNASKPYRLP